MYADGARLPGHGPINAAHELHVPRAAQGEALGKDRCPGGHESVRPLLGLQERDAQPRLLQCDVLQAVHELGLLAGAFVKDRIGERKEAAAGPKTLQLRAGRELLHAFHLFRDRTAQPPHVNAGHVHLPHLFFQRHAAQQVGHAPLDRLRRIAEGPLLRLRGQGKRGGC